MTREQSLAYQRGYNAGRSRKWPEHLPPAPPDNIVKEILDAARRLCNAADAFQATWDEDDEGMKPLRDAIEEFNEKNGLISQWIKKATL